MVADVGISNKFMYVLLTFKGERSSGCLVFGLRLSSVMGFSVEGSVFGGSGLGLEGHSKFWVGVWGS